MLWLLDVLEHEHCYVAMANYIMPLLARELHAAFEMKRPQSPGQRGTFHACVRCSGWYESSTSNANSCASGLQHQHGQVRIPLKTSADL